jgi:hypothetical protein
MEIKSKFNEAQLVEAIEQVAQSERITKATLALLSRELMAFAVEHKTAALVNTLVWGDKLTPRNQQMAKLFFEYFLPFTQQEDKDRPLFKVWSDRKWNSKGKDGKKVAKSELVAQFLAVEANNIWTWASANLKEQELKDRAKTVTAAIKAALTGGKDGKGKKTQEEVLEAVLAGGMTIEAIIALAHKAAAAKEAELKQAA